MREIKFRCFIENEMGGFMIPSENSDCFMVSNGVGFIVYDEYKNIIENRVHIMQFAGLKDTNGVEIYEGDIVTALGSNYNISYHEAGFYLESKIVMYRLTQKIITEENSEVIGNIHENNPNNLTGNQ